MKKIVALVLSLVMVLGLATTAFAVEFNTMDEYDIYQANYDKDNFIEATWMYKVAANKHSDGFGNIAFWADDDDVCYVEISKADASVLDFYITEAGKDEVVAYLRIVDEVYYDFTVKAFTDTAVGYGKCDQIVVPYGDTSKFYKASVDGEDFYFTNNADFAAAEPAVVDTEETYVLMPDGTVAGLYMIFDATVAHQWNVNGYDAKGNVTSAKCYKCEGTAKVFDDAADIAAYTLYFSATLDNGQFTVLCANQVDPDAEYFLVPGKTASAGSAAGETVTSPKTFDAGIAMYVGMSVMAAAGSAVVLKKKD